jgi:hypothetical protein
MANMTEFQKAELREKMLAALVEAGRQAHPTCCMCGKPAYTGDTSTGSVGSKAFLAQFKAVKPALVAAKQFACVDCIKDLAEAANI